MYGDPSRNLDWIYEGTKADKTSHTLSSRINVTLRSWFESRVSVETISTPKSVHYTIFWRTESKNEGSLNIG